MAVDLSPIGGAGAQFFDNNGVPLSGGKLYTYAAATTTPKATYTSGSGNVAHSNPIILDSAGRVPGGEIWLTSGEAYKFVLETPTSILLGTWDNIYGYTSGSAQASTEVQIATAGQTLFVLTSMAYNPGSNTLGVYVDGVNQVVNNAYIESNSTSVTFVSGLHAGAVVKFINLNIASTNANVVTYDPGFTGSVATTVADKLQQTVSVKDFGAVGDGVTDDTAAIQAAVATGETLYFPSGQYRITATIDGTSSEGGWIGDGSGPVYNSTWSPGCTMFLLDGTNSGAAFLKPPKVFRGFHVDGQTSNNIGIQLGQDGSFTAFQVWENIHVRNCDIAFDTYNFFSVAFRDIVVQGNNKGFRMTPADTPADDGYWTATNWTNIHIADNADYGLLAEAPQGTRTWVWSNVVIERNGASGTYQARLQNIGVEVRGGFFEGSSTIPVFELESVTMSITNGFFNGTGGIDFTNNNATLSLDQVTFTSATDVFANVNNNVKIYAKNSAIQSDVRDYAAVFELYNTTTAGVQVPKLVSGITIGRPNIDGIQPRSLSRVVTYRKSITATINAGATVEVITNQYYYDLWSNATMAVASLEYYNQGLVCQVTPANNTSSPHYFCVEITNTTAAPITITAKNLSVFILNSSDFIQL